MSDNTAHRGNLVSEARFRALWNDHSITAADIGRMLDISAQAVKCRAATRGLPHRPGGAGRNRKIEPVLFRAMWDANVSPREIAAHFGVHPQCVSQRARAWRFPKRKCYKHSVVPIVAFFMARVAKSEQAAARAANRRAPDRN
jgi:hypothetical protein